jgi:hypothetical protein
VNRRLIPAALAACFLLLAAPLQAARILVIGDSWGVAAGPALQQVLDDNGNDDAIASIAVGGETAANINTPAWLQQITDALAANPDADFVHLSLGGNDFLGNWSADLSQADEDQLVASILADITAIVDHILEQRPEIRIFWSSYDFPRPLTILGEPIAVNQASIRFSEQSRALADAKGDALTYGDFNGMTQVVYGFDGVQVTPYDPAVPIAPGDPSLPDPQYPGPAVAFADPIHLTANAFLVLAEQQYQQFYETVLGFQINAGLTDAWYNRATSGQGFFITVWPASKLMFVAWFTYDRERPPQDVTAVVGEPGHRWMTAQGSYSGDTASLTINVTKGGTFDSAQPPVTRNPDGDGTMTVEFADCTEGLITYDLPSLGLAGEIPIQRIVEENVPLCESLAE